MPQTRRKPALIRCWSISLPDPACAKYGGRQHRTETIRATGDGISRFVNLQCCRFNVHICERCGFTELYAIRSR